MTENAKQVMQKLENEKAKARSAWRRGVADYAIDLLGNIEEWPKIAVNKSQLEEQALNGAPSWREFSYGGCAAIYDSQIAKTLCNATELKRTDNGRKKPNARETWLDVQARALYQAFRLLAECAFSRE